MYWGSFDSGNEIAFSNRAIGKNRHSSIRNSPTITKSAFPDKTKMTTIYIKLEVSRTDIRTHAHFISIDNARYDCFILIFSILFVSSACPRGPKAVSFRLTKFLLEARWPFSFSKSFCYSVACQSMKVTINTNITIDKVPTDISLCPWHDRLTPY